MKDASEDLERCSSSPRTGLSALASGPFAVLQAGGASHRHRASPHCGGPAARATSALRMKFLQQHSDSHPLGRQ